MVDQEEADSLAFRTSPLPMWIVDTESLAFLAVNDAAVTIYGWSRDEFLRMTILDLRPPAEKAGFVETIRPELAKTDTHDRRTRHVTRDGHVLEVNLRSVPTVHRARPARLAMVEELTPETESRERARNAEQRWHALSRHWPGYILCIDANDRLTWLNRDTQLMSATRDTGRSVFEFVTEEEGVATRALLDETRETSRACTRQTCVTVGGEARYYETRCIPLGTGKSPELLLAVTEVTAGVRAAQAVAKSERRFRAMIENSTEGIALTDRDGKAFYLSPAGAKLFAPHSGKFAAEIHPEDSEAVNEVFLWLKAHPGKSRPMEYRAKARTGQWHSFESTVTNLLEDPAVEAIVGNFRDVTERKRLTEQFLHAQKMEAVGRLAGGIAHDFNNVLCVILSYAEMIIGDLKPEDSLRTEMEEIRRAGLRAADLTRQLLAFSRQQVLEARVLDLNQSVGKMEKILRRLLGEDVELTMHPAPGLWSIKADAGQIEQTVMNLAVNARDAMPQGGALILETANIELGDEDVYAHLGVIPGSYVMLSVTDTGTGMDKETQARIFEPFFTTKEKGKGTGLGLATVFGIVKQSGGHISVDSEPGKGTTFRVYFPRVVGDVSAARVSEAPGPLSERGTETVLLVEDDDQVRTLARSILRRNGYIVLEAPNGGEGLLICEQHPSKIHLLLTDVILPRMSGRQLAERLTKMRPEMKVLFMSGYTEDATLNRSVLESGTAFLQKPLTPDSLARKVREVLREGTREGREKATRAEPKTPTC